MKHFRVVINGNEYRVAIEELEEEGSVETQALKTQSIPAAKPSLAPASAAAPKVAVAKPERSAAGSAGSIIAAMPGTILEVIVKVGDAVERGQSLLVLEAMKMENDIMAPCDGVVKEILAVKGSSVNSGDLLMVLA